MILTRKEFLAQGIFSLGKMLLPPRESQRLTDRHYSIRPPGFIAENADECGTCEQCCTACPERIIARVAEVDGPVMDFSAGGCRFCYLCIGSCPRKVMIFPAERERPRLGVACLGTGCIAGGGCFTCSERCPEGAIDVVWGKGILIDPDRCVGCGTCESCCPVRPKAIGVKSVD